MNPVRPAQRYGFRRRKSGGQQFSRISSVGKLVYGMNLSWLSNQKTKLILECHKEALKAAKLRGRELLAFETIPLRETPEENLLSRIRSLNGKTKPGGAILILPRESLLEREFEVNPEGEDLREAIRRKILQAVPYDLKALSYGVEVEEQGETLRATLLAVPRTYLDPYLTLLEKLDLEPEEVISRDQALLIGAKELTQEETFCLFHLEGETLDLVLVKEGKLTLSRTFSTHQEDLFHDLEFSLLETEAPPKKLFLTGREDPHFELKLREAFSIPIQRISAKEEIPLSLYGASLVQKHKPLSLLPKEIRLERLRKERKKETRLALFSFMLLLSLASLGFILHSQTQHAKLKALSARLEALKPEVERLTGIQETLESVNRAKEHKLRILDLMRELSLQVPGEVVFDELTLDEEDLRIKGQSPTYQGVSGTLASLESLSFIQGAKLEYARMRKNRSQDFFEFEVKAQWKKESGGSLGHRVQGKEIELQKAQSLVSQKEALEQAYKEFNLSASPGLGPDELLNQWVGELTTQIEREGLKLDKLEPQGIRSRGNPRGHEVFLRFGGPMENFLSFLYRLGAIYPTVSVRKVKVFRGDPERTSTTSPQYELGLGKLIA